MKWVVNIALYAIFWLLWNLVVAIIFFDGNAGESMHSYGDAIASVPGGPLWAALGYIPPAIFVWTIRKITRKEGGSDG